jgi:hypothetical protein
MNLYRSLIIERPPDESLLKLLEWLAEEGFLQNNLKLHFWSMKNLEELDLFVYEPEVLARVFESCSKITDLLIDTYEYETREMAEHLKNQLRSGFQRLRRFEFGCFIDNDSLPVIQEMLT